MSGLLAGHSEIQHTGWKTYLSQLHANAVSGASGLGGGLGGAIQGAVPTGTRASGPSERHYAAAEIFHYLENKQPGTSTADPAMSPEWLPISDSLAESWHELFPEWFIVAEERGKGWSVTAVAAHESGLAIQCGTWDLSEPDCWLVTIVVEGYKPRFMRFVLKRTAEWMVGHAAEHLTAGAFNALGMYPLDRCN